MDNQIQIKGGFRHEEGLASGTVAPGMLLEITSAAADTVRAHATEGGYAERAFAVEDALQGNTIEDDYSAADLVSYHLVEPGAVVQALIEAGANIAKGDKLISAGNGNLIENGTEATATTVVQIIAIAMDACDLTATGAVDTLCKVRVL
jgi:hypothetical protein